MKCILTLLAMLAALYFVPWQFWVAIAVVGTVGVALLGTAVYTLFIFEKWRQ